MTNSVMVLAVATTAATLQAGDFWIRWDRGDAPPSDEECAAMRAALARRGMRLVSARRGYLVPVGLRVEHAENDVERAFFAS